MSGRRIRNLVLLALVAGLAWWIYRDRPTLAKPFTMDAVQKAIEGLA